MNPEELIQFFQALDNMAKFRFACRYHDLNADDRREVRELAEGFFTCGFGTFPDMTTTWTSTQPELFGK
jgi:hypothetical protein